MVLDFAILSVCHFLHVDDSLDVTGGNLHDDGDTHIAVDQLQFVDDGTLSQILHAYVDGRNDVGTVNGRYICDVQESITHLAAVNDTILSA